MLHSALLAPAHSGAPSLSISRPAFLTVQLIGKLSIRRGDTVLDARQLGGPKPRQILEILLLNLGTPVSKDRLIEIIWEGRAPAEALPTLESYVSVLRRNIQPGCRRNGPLATTTGGYVMDASLVDLDVHRFDELLRHALHSSPAHALTLLRKALALDTAPLLGDELLPAWAEEERELHKSHVLEASVLAAKWALAEGALHESVEWAQRALQLDPLNERAWLALVISLERSGRQTEALQSYERCRRAMARELGCCPGRELREAHARLLQATAEDEGDLSDVLSALLVLHGQLTGATSEALATVVSPSNVTQSLREASNVLSAFLKRALSTT